MKDWEPVLVPLVGVVVAVWAVIQPLAVAWVAYQVGQLRKRMDASDEAASTDRKAVKDAVESVKGTVRASAAETQAAVRQGNGGAQ